LDFVAWHDEPTSASVERHIANGAIGTDGDEGNFTNARVLVVDARYIDANVVTFGTPDSERMRTKFDPSRLTKTTAWGNDKVHALVTLARSTVLPKGRQRCVKACTYNLAQTWPVLHNHATLSRMSIEQNPTPSERRRRRSADPLVALHYQLTSARSRAEIDTIVVADASGLVVAGAGSWPVCEELAAYAPLLAERAEHADQGAPFVSAAVSSRVETLRHEVEVRHVAIGEQNVLLCAHWQRGGQEYGAGSVLRDVAQIDHAAAGVRRILMQRNQTGFDQAV
jgi:hypothetical protein